MPSGSMNLKRQVRGSGVERWMNLKTAGDQYFDHFVITAQHVGRELADPRCARDP